MSSFHNNVSEKLAQLVELWTKDQHAVSAWVRFPREAYFFSINFISLFLIPSVSYYSKAIIYDTKLNKFQLKLNW